MDEKEKPRAYVQRVNGQEANFYTEDDLKVEKNDNEPYFDFKVKSEPIKYFK
jgi:hypothetical protein